MRPLFFLLFTSERLDERCNSCHSDNKNSKNPPVCFGDWWAFKVTDLLYNLDHIFSFVAQYLE